jgi:outer membrane lipoprotein-sorting protein
MRPAIGLLGVVLFGRTAIAQPQPDVTEILKKVGATYQAATEYEFVVDGTIPADKNGTEASFHMLFAFKPPNKYRLEGAMPGMGFGHSESIAVHDGVNLWFYMPKENQYGSIPGEKLTPGAPGDLGDASPEFLNMAFRKSFGEMMKGAALVREENLSVNGARASCYVFETRSGTFWVDKSRYVILQAQTGEARIVFTSVKLNESLPDDLFKFEPPPGAKRVEVQP